MDVRPLLTSGPTGCVRDLQQPEDKKICAGTNAHVKQLA